RRLSTRRAFKQTYNVRPPVRVFAWSAYAVLARRIRGQVDDELKRTLRRTIFETAQPSFLRTYAFAQARCLRSPFNVLSWRQVRLPPRPAHGKVGSRKSPLTQSRSPPPRSPQ